MSPFRCLSRQNLPTHLAVVGITMLALTLAGCVSTQAPQHAHVYAQASQHAALKTPHPTYIAMYGPQPDERFPLPATDISTIDPKFLRREAAYNTPERPGTILVDTANRYLYLVRENGRALRYGIGVGADGMKWVGRAQVARKAMWPRWTPTAAMNKRDPERNRPWANGMPPGLSNPLGPRALYLYQDGRDTLYRIHGTTEPHTIGEAVSSGCIRMLNPDILDLYSRVPVGSSVVVLPDTRTAGAALKSLAQSGHDHSGSSSQQHEVPDLQDSP
jgi:lipoprotein-anchoring transpeptidase ErfK/SrfK